MHRSDPDQGTVVVGAVVGGLEVLDELVVLEELLVELDEVLFEEGRVVDGVDEPSESSEGTAVAGLAPPTSPVLETLG